MEDHPDFCTHGVALIKDFGYHVEVQVLNTMYIGLTQSRPRMRTAAIRNSALLAHIEWSNPVPCRHLT